MLAAAERGHEVCHVDPRDLSLHHGDVRAALTPVDVHDDHARPFTRRQRTEDSLAGFDVVWIRTDPPVDRAYLYTTLLLDHLPDSVHVVNRPAAIRDWNEKLAALIFPDWTPATLVAARRELIEDFAGRHGRITVKPVDGHGGKGIQFLDGGQPDLGARIDEATGGGRRWVIAQRYLPAARDGDKRILLLDGRPIGAILRVHAEGQELNNLDAGGSAHASSLAGRDREICDTIGPELRSRGIVFAGIDVIGGMLMEINVTSPTGLQEMCRFDGQPYHHRIIEALERR
jgi:glutathione synthase